MPEPLTRTTQNAEPVLKYERWLVSAILVLYATMLAWGDYCHSPIADEPAYLASGISHWQHGHFELCKVSPPLVRLVAAVPVVLSGAKLDVDGIPVYSMARLEHQAGRELLRTYGKDSFWLFTLGRWACIPFALLGAWICYRWAKQLFGSYAGLAGLVLWCVSPSVLAHAQMLNADIGVTSLSLATCYLFWQWSKRLDVTLAIAAGAVLGLAVLAKTNAVVLPPIVCLASISYRYFRGDVQLVKQCIQLSCAFAVALYVINTGYGFAGSFKPLKDFHFVSRAFTGQSAEPGKYAYYGSILDHVPLPLPAAFVEGIDLQKRDFENATGNFRTYLRGKWYDHSWWWYYLYVCAVKVPVGTWLLIALGGYLLLWGKVPNQVDVLCFVVLPSMAMFCLASTQTGFGAGVRYVLPAFPFAFLLASASFYRRVSQRLRAFAVVALIFGPIASLYTFPHSLCYFNLLAGGPKHGHFHLIDSNMEWGQNLLYVKDWVERNKDEEPIYVAHWSFYPIDHLEMDFTQPKVNPTGPIPPGTYLISTNFLRGNPHMNRMELRRFLELIPDERIAYTTYVYRIP